MKSIAAKRKEKQDGMGNVLDRKKMLLFIFVVACFLIISVGIWCLFYSLNGCSHFFVMNVLTGLTGANDDCLELYEGDVAEFSFVSFTSFNDLSLFVQSPHDSTLQATLLASGWELIQDNTIDIEAGTNGFERLFSNLKTSDQRETYILRIELKEGEAIKVRSRNGGTAIKATNGFPFVFVLYTLINVLIVLAAFCFMYAKWYRQFPLSKVFVFVALPIIVITSILLYPGTACDENDHYVAAYILSSKIMGEDITMVREEDTGIIYNRWAVPNMEGVYMAMSQVGHRSGNQAVVKNVHNGHTGQDIIYFLPAVGITIGRILNLNAFTTYYLARFMNVLLYLTVGYITLTIARYGVGILFCFLLLPLTINQCISVNQDCFCFVISFLAISYWTKIRYGIVEEKRKLTLMEFATIAMLFIILLSCKAYVLVMGVYCILPWSQMYGASWKRVGTLIFAVAFGFALLIGIMEVSGKVGYATSLINMIFGKIDTSSYSLAYFAGRPLDFVAIIFATVKEQLFLWFWDAFGSRLSWETYFSPIYAISFATIIFLLAVSEDSVDFRIPALGKWLVILIQLGFMGIVIVRALYWTGLGRETIWGIQGRYFIPVLPLVFFSCIPQKPLKIIESQHLISVFVILLMVLCGDLLNLHLMCFLVE